MRIVLVLIATAMVTGCFGGGGGGGDDLPRCDTTADCDVGVCEERRCVPGEIGDACAAPSECDPSLACALGFPSGYCTVQCDPSEPCEAGARCIVRAGQGLCFAGCENDGDCRSGYVCSGGVCDVPCTQDAECGAGETCQVDRCEHSGIGESCSASPDCTPPLGCTSGACTAGCSTNSNCPAGGACGPLGKCVEACRADVDCGSARLCDRGGCVAPCQSDADCGLGGTCTAATGLCQRAGVADVATLDLGAVQQFVEYSFEVPNGAFSITIQVLGTQGVEMGFTTITNPVGQEMIVRDGTGFTSPLRVFPQTEVITAQIPNGDSPQLAPLPGTWRFRYQGPDGTGTVWIKTSIDGRPEGGFVNLNIFMSPNAFPGGVDASSAGSDPFVQDTLASWTLFFEEQADIATARIRYFDLDATQDDLDVSLDGSDGPQNELWRLGRNDGLNIFFVRSLGGAAGGGIAGIAGGLPGPPLTAGTAHSGVVVEVQETTAITGIDYCHEVGHFLGLFHVSEFFGQAHDTLSDTPECSPPFGECTLPQTHLMYPALGPGQRTLSPASAMVIQSNAGVR